jgi:hypothetical protein
MSVEVIEEMSPEVIATRDALVKASSDDPEFVESFKARTFKTEQEVYEAYATRGEPTDEGTPEVAPSEGESLIAGKFKTPEELEKAYLELQAKLGAPKEPPKAPSDDSENALSIKAKETTESLGLSMDELQSHYNEHNSLSEDHYVALAKGGLDKATVDAFIGEIAEARTLKAQVQIQEATKFAQSIKESVGGDEAYASMVTWAGQNWTAEQVQAYDKATDSGDPALVRLAVDGLKAQYQANVGQGSTKGFVKGASQASSGLSGFESQQEMANAMNDSRYQTLPSFREAVRQRLARTTAF